ncbi:MAG: fluoride efflux transporter CrcB [Bacillota bacterium]
MIMGIEYLMVFIGGSLGAVCRFAVSIQMKRIISTEFPLATFLINVTGSFFLGLLLSSHTGNLIQLMLGTGFLGGFTTFSTFQVENVTLYKKGNLRTLLLYVSLSVFFCVMSACFGLRIGDWLQN